MNQALGLVALSALLFANDEKAQDGSAQRLEESATMLTEIMAAPDQGIPTVLLRKAYCIVVVPNIKKDALGKGFISCRSKRGEGWSAPGAIRLEGGSFGLPIGGPATGIIMLAMHELSAQRLLSGEGDLAAGQVGHTATAQPDAKKSADLLSWSRTRGGLFAEIVLKGTTLRQDLDANESLYGQRLQTREIVMSGLAPAPPSARKLLSVLSGISSSAKQPTCDLNGDGVVDQLDVQIELNQVLGIARCANGDLNGDGSCNVIDLQRVTNAALGQSCQTGP